MNDSIIDGVANILFRNDLDDFVDGPRVPWGQKHYRHGNNYAQCMQDDMPDGVIVWMAVVVYLHQLMADV
jgi:hypothetical protein